MYLAEELKCYPFFDHVLQNTPLEMVHDPLTGLINRGYMLRFIRDLIDRGTPFTLAMLDLDNFKRINDTCGHAAGDYVLSTVSADIMRYVGADGVVGRFGGDELLIVQMKALEYNDVHLFFKQMYSGRRILRRTLPIGHMSTFITGTVGCASYPKDSDQYDSLFHLIDKALYRGKSKGRNCFIIYVPEKHDQLEIPALARRSLYETILQMAACFEQNGDARDNLTQAFSVIRRNLNLSRLLYLCEDNRLIDAESGKTAAVLECADVGLPDEVATLSGISQDEERTPLKDALQQLGYESVMTSRVTGSVGGYRHLLFCPEPHTMRIWQDNEYVAAFLLSAMFSQHLKMRDGHSE